MASEGALPEVPAAMETSRDGGSTLVVRLRGAWRLAGALPSASEVVEELERTPATSLRVDAAGVSTWDSGLVVFLYGRARGLPGPRRRR